MAEHPFFVIGAVLAFALAVAAYKWNFTYYGRLDKRWKENRQWVLVILLVALGAIGLLLGFGVI